MSGRRENKEDCMTDVTFQKSSAAWLTVLAIGSGLAFAGCRSAAAEPRKNEPPPAVKVDTVTVSQRTLPRFLTLTGTLLPNQKADVAADVSGKIQKTFVERGSFVTQGFALASVDPRSAAISTTEASAQARALEAQSNLASADCERAEKLFRDGALSQAEHERQAAQCQATGWSKKAAQARAQLAGKMLGDSTIRAPFSGIISERLVTVGEYVRPDTRVVTLVDIDTLRLELTVSESDIGNVHEGQVVGFHVASFGDEDFSATVKYVGPALRRASRDLLVEASLDNAARKLKPGMFATAKIELGTYDSPVVPATAVREEGSTRHIFVVKEKKLEERVVETGEQVGDVVAIAKGVAPGEQIVARNGSDLKDGSSVQ
jgi:membrane fusion protein (multidrug efflux system)